MKKFYDSPKMEIYRILAEDILTASGGDDTAGDIWSGGVDPEIVT